MKPPLPRYVGDCYAFRWQDESVDIELDGVHEARGGELRAVMSVTSTRFGPKGLLHEGDFNMNGPRARADVVRLLATRVGFDDVDWYGVLELVCHLAREHWREGDPLVRLGDHVPEHGDKWLLEPWVEWGGPTVVFAMGGTGKSLFGLAIAVTIATGQDIGIGLPTKYGRVAYLDWETEIDTHHERLNALCAAADICPKDVDIYYRRQSASLASAATHLRRLLVKENIHYVIVDSLGMARGGEPESADTTIKLFQAARSLEVPWTGIDHVTKNGGEGQKTPFGSIYTHNSARRTWGVEKVEEPGMNAISLLFKNHKANNGRELPPRAYQLEIRSEDDRMSWAQYRRTEVMQTPGFESAGPLNLRIADVLKHSSVALSPEQIAERLDGANVASVRTVLNRFDATFQFVRSERNGRSETRFWGLKSDREEGF